MILKSFWKNVFHQRTTSELITEVWRQFERKDTSAQAPRPQEACAPLSHRFLLPQLIKPLTARGASRLRPTPLTDMVKVMNCLGTGRGSHEASAPHPSCGRMEKQGQVNPRRPPPPGNQGLSGSP